MPQTVTFVKATACGNDFILIDGNLVPADRLADVTRRICHRNLGVGADGVEWLYSVSDADIHARLFNADGSEAEISGNGTRCVASWLATKHDKADFVIRTGAGLKTCTLTARDGNNFEFKSNMGVPEVGEDIAVKLPFGDIPGTPVSMGNPHFVLFVDSFKAGWQNQAAIIGTHSDFPQGTNVELVKVISPEEIEIRIFERGAGETQSSGTGSCASAVAAIHTNRARSPLRVVSPGGPQMVEWAGDVLLYGPATLICHGEFFI